MKRADGYTSDEFKSNTIYSEQHANDLAQHIDYSELHDISSYSEQAEQDAEYLEQYVNF